MMAKLRKKESYTCDRKKVKIAYGTRYVPRHRETVWGTLVN